MVGSWKVCLTKGKIVVNKLEFTNIDFVHAHPIFVLLSYILMMSITAFVHPYCMDTLNKAITNQAQTSILHVN